MALADEVEARISATRLVQLTNPEDSTATTVDATLLGKAATDVQAELELHAGVTYDGSNPVHVLLAVSGVVAKLQEYTGSGGEFADAHRQKYERGLEKLRDRQLVPPTSSSALTPSAERQGRPLLDRARFGGYTARATPVVDEAAES